MTTPQLCRDVEPALLVRHDSEVAPRAAGESVLTRVNRILESFSAETPTQTVSDIARRAGLPVATSHRLVNELERLGYLERNLDRRLQIGQRLWELGSRSSRTLRLRRLALPIMIDLHGRLQHNVQLAVLDGLEALFIERLTTHDEYRIIQVAGRLPAHACSSGLVLLAYASPLVQERLWATELPRFTQLTVTDQRELRALLAEIRRTDHVVVNGIMTAGAGASAVPVRNPRGEVIAALNVVAPSAENGLLSHLAALHHAARRITDALAHDSGRDSGPVPALR
jgi:DNA-binding IclR family transcriptional regulator